MFALAYDIQQLDHCQASSRCQLHCRALRIPASRLTVVSGQPGAGTSSLLAALAGTQATVCGQLFGQPLPCTPCHVAHLSATHSAHGRQSLQRYLLQGRTGGRWLRRSEAIDHEAVACTLHSLALDKLAHRRVDSLDAGQRQLARLARELARPVPVLLLDEPGSLLPPSQRHAMLAQLARLALRGRTIVCALQDTALAEHHAHWLIQLHDGHVHQQGPASDVRLHVA